MILAKQLGFEGMLVLHPKITSCTSIFSPSDEEVEWATEMLKLSEEAVKMGRVFVKENKFIIPHGQNG